MGTGSLNRVVCNRTHPYFIKSLASYLEVAKGFIERLPLTPTCVLLHFTLLLLLCDIKQTGDLHYLGLRGHWEKSCHGNGPLQGCQNCLIIQDHHHRAPAGNQPEALKRLKDEIKKFTNHNPDNR